ncbi:FAD-binding protein [bacterium BD-1]|nr:FAD-binding protein [Ottowia caeni]
MSTPLVVGGAGVAGLAVALSAAPRPVLLVSRGRPGAASASALAQGGIAAALGEGDDPAQHAQDTMVAGAGHNDAARVDWLVSQAPAAVGWLEEQGVVFDRGDKGYRLGREGGHGRHRIVHARGDATGAAVVAALAECADAAAHVTWLDAHTLRALGLREGRIAGLRLADAAGIMHELPAADVVLATGGLGALFAATTNPRGADGFGLALALEARAAARDLEFIQFHPTALDVAGDGPRPLLTEALRGAGSVLRDERGGLLMAGRHPLGDLAPRDVVSREVLRHRRGGGSVWLDATVLGERLAADFPTAITTCRAHGIDPLREWIPVAPAAHFHMGGVAVDALGRSTLPGLHAVGEVACNGVHGANRLASNSLLEGVAFGRRLGAWLARNPTAPAGTASRWVMPGDEASPFDLRTLRALLDEALGPVRDGEALRRALARIAAMPGLSRAWQGRLALRLLHAALARRGSLGAHWREDACENASIHQRIATPAYGEIP